MFAAVELQSVAKHRPRFSEPAGRDENVAKHGKRVCILGLGLCDGERDVIRIIETPLFCEDEGKLELRVRAVWERLSRSPQDRLCLAEAARASELRGVFDRSSQISFGGCLCGG